VNERSLEDGKSILKQKRHSAPCISLLSKKIRGLSGLPAVSICVSSNTHPLAIKFKKKSHPNVLLTAQHTHNNQEAFRMDK
jgi:hypothetical protein